MTENETPLRPDVHFREQIGARKLGNPEGFRFYRWEFIDPDTTVMTGCVVTRMVTRGKRKGLPVYDGKPLTVAVQDREIAEARAKYEMETGNCGGCMGSKQEWLAWHHDSGNEFGTCRACNGTGKVPA